MNEMSKVCCTRNIKFSDVSLCASSEKSVALVINLSWRMTCIVLLFSEWEVVVAGVGGGQ